MSPPPAGAPDEAPGTTGVSENSRSLLRTNCGPFLRSGSAPGPVPSPSLQARRISSAESLKVCPRMSVMV